MNQPPRKVLIIKTGQTEFLAEDNGDAISLGDVYCTTSLLWEFVDSKVSWITSAKALPLLPDKPFVDTALVYSSEILEQVSEQSFDLIINLETDPAIKECVEHLHSKCGARVVEKRNGNGASREKSFQYHLFQTVGLEFNEQPYTLPKGVDINKEPNFDVGLNFEVGSKWPTKAWPMNKWDKLAALCETEAITYSFQQGFKDLYKYMSWIQENRVIVSSDSLGLHLGIGLNRHAIAMFGPTEVGYIHFYDQGEPIRAQSPCPKLPCYQSKCDFAAHCMEEISPEYVFSRIKDYVAKTNFSPKNIGESTKGLASP